jgi:hypothetical protein
VGRTETLLRCVECGAESDQAGDRLAGLPCRQLDENERAAEVLMFCQDCAEREFGPFDGLSD